jgi:transcriptional regulator with XRE-family HTH domain
MNACRKDMGLSVTRMAQLIGVSRSLLSLYEVGKRNLPPKASLLETRIVQLWIQLSTGSVKRSSKLNSLLQEQEKAIDKKLSWEQTLAERRWSELSTEIKKMPENFLREMVRYNLIKVLSGWPELQKVLPALNKTRITQERNLKAWSPAEMRWLYYRIELAHAQKELARKWKAKPLKKT